MTSEQYTITLRPLPGDSRPATQRLRQLLKLARRSCGLRCTRLAGAGIEQQDGERIEVTPCP